MASQTIVVLFAICALGGVGVWLFCREIAFYADPDDFNTYQSISEDGLVFGVLGVILLVLALLF